MTVENPTRTFKDFIGWAFVGMAGIILGLIVMLYTSLHADVAALDTRTMQHVERIKGTEDRVDGVRESLRRIEDELKLMNQKLDIRR